MTTKTTTAATRYLTQKGGRIAYDENGTGPLVLCVPGMGELRQEYRYLAPLLVEAGYRVVTMDVRGHGESSTQWGDVSVGAIGADVVALLRHLDAGPAVLVGNSMGCAATIWAAAEAPDMVAGLVLTGPAVRDGGMPAWAGRLLYSTLFAAPWGVAAWGRYYKTLYPSAQPPDFAAYLARLLANLREPGRLAVLRRMIMASKAAATARIGQVHGPALVVMGTRDPDFKDATAEARWVAGQLHGELRLIDGAGHYPHVEKAAQVNPAIVAFVQRAGQGSREPVRNGA